MPLPEAPEAPRGSCSASTKKSRTLLGDWTTRQLHVHILARHRLREDDYTLGQLRYDLGKLRAHGLVARVGRSRRYRLTPVGVRLGALLVKIRTRLLGPIFALAPTPCSDNPTTVEAALRTVDRAPDPSAPPSGSRPLLPDGSTTASVVVPSPHTVNPRSSHKTDSSTGQGG